MRYSRGAKLFRLTAVFSMLFALIGFSYNVWRMEVTEQNASRREAAFEMLREMAALEQIIFAAHYDNDTVNGNPRLGWVRLSMISDLAILMPIGTQDAAAELKRVWQHNWALISKNRPAAKAVLAALDHTRLQVRNTLTTLE